MKRKRKNLSDVVLDTVIYAILIFLVVVTLYPVWFVFVASFASSTEVALSKGLMLWPKEFMLGAYELVFEYDLLMSGFLNSIKVLVMGLPINIILTMFAGYFMACTGMKFKKPIVYMMMFTMYFSGGLVPGLLNIRDLGLIDTTWALVLPGALSVYNAIICKTAIEAIPESLQESAYLDGANDLQIIGRIVFPLIKPTLAVLLLYYGVAHWNSWFAASIYIRDPLKLPVQNIIRNIMQADSALATSVAAGDSYDTYYETIKYAAIVMTMVPIMCVYPFLQKYFAKGAMIGAVKG